MSKRARHNGEGSIYPYRNGFAAYVWVNKPDGTRDRKYVYGQDREIVHAKWVKLHAQASQGPVATRVPKLGPFLDRWLEEVIKPNRAPLTHATYESHVRLYIKPGLGDKKITFTVREAQAWINTLPHTCQCCAQGKDTRRHRGKSRCCAIGQCCEDYPTARTISDIRTCLRSALSRAMVEELVPKNIASLLALPKVRKVRNRSWTSEEARKFLESARGDNDPYYAGYVLVLANALRKGEVLGLEETDVDLDAEEFEIAHQLQRVRKQLLHRETKTEASDALMPLPPISVTAIKIRLARKKLDKERAGVAWQGSRLLLTTELGLPVEPRTFNRAWDARCAKAGVRKIKVHDARGTCGTLLADLDVHPRVAMRILRHANFSITMEIYTQASSKKTREALRRLSESLGSGNED
jgi:integrase